MSLFKILSPRLFAIRRRDEIEREIDEELCSHLEMRTQDLIASGMTPEKAREIAAHRFGDMERIKEMCCEVHSGVANRESVKLLVRALAGFALAFWTMSREYHNLPSVLLLLTAIAIMLRSLFVAHHLSRTKSSVYALAGSSESAGPLRILETDEPPNISAHDEHGRTPIEQVFDEDE